MLLYFYQRNDLPLYTIGVLSCIVDAFLSPVSNIIIGKLFNALSGFQVGSYTSDAFMSRVLELCAGMWSLALIQMFSCWVSHFVWTVIGYRHGHRARSQLYASTVSRDVEWFDENEKAIGSATMSFKDVQDLEYAVGTSTRDILTTSISIVLQLIVSFYYSWSITLICMIGVPIMAFSTYFLSIQVHTRVIKAKSLLDTISTAGDWALRSLSTVVSFQKQGYEKEKMEELLKNELKLNMGQHQFSALLQAIGRFLVLSIFVQGFFFGSYMVRSHGVNSGNVMTVFWSCLSLTTSLNTMLSLLMGLQRGIVSAQRLSSAIERDTTSELKTSIGIVPSNFDYGTGEVVFDEVVFSYPTRPTLVLAGLSLKFEAGKTTYILGPSGSGKSSLAALMGGQYEYQAGQITINNVPLPHISTSWLEHTVYVVEQQAKLFDIPLSENIRIGATNPASVSFSDIEKVCDLVGADFIADLPRGLLTPGSYQLSGGQKQRIGLARALLRDAPIMVFDESTSALDPSMRSHVMKAVLEYRRNKTNIIITHQMDIIPPQAPIHFIQDGRAYQYKSLEQYKRQSVVPMGPPKQRVEHEIPISVEPKSEKRTAMFILKTTKQKGLLFCGFALVAAQAVVNPLFAFFFSKLLMGILPQNHVNTTLWALLVLLLAFTDGLLTYSHIVLDYVSENWQLFIRKTIYDNLLSRRFLDESQVSYYTKLLFSDTEKASLILASYWPAMVNLVVLGVVSLVWSLAEGWELSLIGLSIAPLFFVATQFHKFVNSKWNIARETRRNEALKLLVEVVEGFRTVKTQHLEHYFGTLYARREDRVQDLAINMGLSVGFALGIVKIFPFAAQGLLLWYGMHLIAQGKYTSQQTMMVFTILIFALMTMISIAASVTSVGNGFEAVSRLEMAISDDQDQDELQALSVGEARNYDSVDFSRLSFRDIGITYPNGTSVLGGFYADIDSKQAVAVIGPSGIGKSTLARLLLKLQTPSTGNITVDGSYPLQKIPSDIVRRKIAVVGQMPLDFLDGTIMENLMYACPPDMSPPTAESKAKNACRACGLEEFIMKLEDGYGTKIKSGLLSGGQMQRLGIARCLIREPDLLVLDECTSALDDESTEVIKDLLTTIKERRLMSLLIITHQMDLAAIADKTVSLFQ
ncbi:Alpha-factor-transporting ATPase [Wickerhamiella sorbophila]|uniref:Alpha-factor-transporting ATPase n=1 Tax=Wickerhamiella sorbophila TaxID=45607 RepID=A0A2T0FKC5_9ASCO|nr:Alpha-factor-transporting ATPase [Wickerhamiella sorbophila]PRT55425.1 Alpha-factor-transporting ATPase [Wickerhamiella sorbophila]